MKHVFTVWLCGNIIQTLVYTHKVTAPQVKKDLLSEGYDKRIIVVKR